MAKPLRIVFMGTPDFAVPCFNALQSHGHEIVMVVTQPDRPKGRGVKVCCPPVKDAAVCMECPCEVFQPLTIKNDLTEEKIRSAEPDLLVVVAFGQILPQKILDIPRLGAINVHASLLPKLRGSAPIQWAILNGEIETGITTMKMDAGLDTGDILLQAKIPILANETAEILHCRLSQLGADALIDTLKSLQEGTLSPVHQDPALATHAPMLKREDGRIDWRRSAVEIERWVRGMTPWPGAFTFLGKNRLKIFNCEVLSISHDDEPGTVLPGFEGEIRVATGKGVLSILELQSASNRRMTTRDYLRGHMVPPGARLSA
jgi:methionyl-tRNA formyltransferase